MHRRHFLGLGTAAAAALMLDPERLLWVPGAKTFFLPSQQIVTAETMEAALAMGFVARLPRGDGAWITMETRLGGGGDGLTLAERLRREVVAVREMGGHVVTNTQYVRHTIPAGTIGAGGTGRG